MKKIIIVCSLFLYGCTSTIQSQLNNVQQNFRNGDFETTTDSQISDQSSLDLLINGSALFHANKFSESDNCFEEFNKRYIKETSSSFVRETGGVLFGNMINSYKPYMMDSLFVSYYQIWDLLAMGDMENARVVINQSYQRQQNMSREYEELIKENKNKISELPDELTNKIDKNVNDWAAFTDIMNPALMYLSGIYFLNTGDFDNAITYLNRANGMMPYNTYIQQDLKLAKNRKKPNNVTWEFIETGFSPRLKEENINLFLPAIGIINFAISEPVFDTDSSNIENAQLLTNVNQMFMTEYNEYRINEVLRTYTNTISKAALQASLYNSKNNSAPLLGILSSVYTLSTSNAEIRTWATLPEKIYIKRIENNKTNLNANNTDVNIKGNNLIYIRMNNMNITDKKIINLK